MRHITTPPLFHAFVPVTVYAIKPVSTTAQHKVLHIFFAFSLDPVPKTGNCPQGNPQGNPPIYQMTPGASYCLPSVHICIDMVLKSTLPKQF